jgi:hypothetical protein
MKVLRAFALPLAALLFPFLFVPQSALATTANCPVEPKPNVPIASGDVFGGTNCTLKTTGDVDSFVFSANAGDIYQLVAGINTGSENICLALYSPTNFTTPIFSECSIITYPNYQDSVVTVQKLIETGTYTMVVSEETDGTLNYGTSLERIYPTPSDGQKVTLGGAVAGNVTPVADTPAFTFAGVTTGEYQVTASVPSTATQNLCITVYSASGSLITPSVATEKNPGCTIITYPNYQDTVTIDFTPSAAGTYLAILNEGGDAGTVGYNFEVSCLVGNCIPPPPSCTLTDTLTYDATTSTLTMNFTVGNTYATTWNAWLTYDSTVVKVFPATAQPITNPPVTIVKTASLPKKGEVGVLSTLSTTSKGIVCSSFAKLATGTP